MQPGRTSMAELNVGLDQFRVGGKSGQIFVGFESLRGLIDMLRFAGALHVHYDGGDSFVLCVQDIRAKAISERANSFGIKMEVKE